MFTTAFLFPGQGSQYAGMGKSLAEALGSRGRLRGGRCGARIPPFLNCVLKALRRNWKRTEITQPALVTVSTAAFRALQAKGLAPDYVAGHSLGEYSALVAAQSLDFADAVVRSGSQARPLYAGGGARWRGRKWRPCWKLLEGTLDRILAEAAQGEVVSAADLNSPDQIVIAGHAGAVERAAELAKAAGAKRAVMLPVAASSSIARGR